MRLMLEVEMPAVITTHLESGDLKTRVLMTDGTLRFDYICSELKAGRFQLYNAWMEETMSIEGFKKELTKFQEEQIKTRRSLIRRNATVDPMWAAQRIITLEEEVEKLKEEVARWQNDYWGVTPEESRRGL